MKEIAALPLPRVDPRRIASLTTSALEALEDHPRYSELPHAVRELIERTIEARGAKEDPDTRNPFSN